jgi:hypothetical protein
MLGGELCTMFEWKTTPPHARGRFGLTGRGMRDYPAEPTVVAEEAEAPCRSA